MKILFKHYRTNNLFIMPRKGEPKKRWLWPLNLLLNERYPVAPRGGKTVCQIILAEGEATCSMSDQFCYKTGRELAFERALEQVPDNMLAEVILAHDGGEREYAEHRARAIIIERRK
jgi:hypothetical protein